MNATTTQRTSMNTTVSFKWFERVTIILSAVALLIAFISLPNTPPSVWGWLVLATILFAFSIVGAAYLMRRRAGQTREGNFLLSHINASSCWLAARVYLGATWLQAGLEKLVSPAWTHGGLALKGFWIWSISAQAGPHPQVAYSWYGNFLQFMLVHHAYSWFAWVITLSELSVGILLLLGLFTGFAAFAGGSLNLLYLLAGSAGVNPIMLILSLFLLMAWKVSGHLGLDRVVLPAVTGLFNQRKANKVTRKSVPDITMQPTKPAFLFDESHGFE